MIYTTTLERKHLIQEVVMFTPIALLVSWLDILFCVTSSTGKWYHMVKFQYVVRKNCLFTDVAPHAVALKDSFQIDSLSQYMSHELAISPSGSLPSGFTSADDAVQRCILFSFACIPTHETHSPIAAGDFASIGKFHDVLDGMTGRAAFLRDVYLTGNFGTVLQARLTLRPAFVFASAIYGKIFNVLCLLASVAKPFCDKQLQLSNTMLVSPKPSITCIIRDTFSAPPAFGGKGIKEFFSGTVGTSFCWLLIGVIGLNHSYGLPKGCSLGFIRASNMYKPDRIFPHYITNPPQKQPWRCL